MTAPSPPLAEHPPSSLGDAGEEQWLADLPRIDSNDHFLVVVRELSIFFVDEITLPYTFEQFRATYAADKLQDLVDHLVINTSNRVLISALLTLKWHFSILTTDDPGINEARALACEIVAWRFLTRLSERDAVDYCLYEIPPLDSNETMSSSISETITERSSLLPRFQQRAESGLMRPRSSRRDEMQQAVQALGSSTPPLKKGIKKKNSDPTTSFIGLTPLEIAVVADCKKFLSQALIQKIITGIWRGDIMFWGSLNENAVKQAQFYDRHDSDPHSRLRVPKYIKIFEFAFFVTFLFFYYVVLVERDMYHINLCEILLYVWFAAFAYDEFSEFLGAGTMVYSIDIWNAFDSIILLIGAAFITTRMVGLYNLNDATVNVAFDILSLEALFMVPRLCSLLSLLPYFATLIPCLKAMIKDFVKFMMIVGIIFVGFLTTFSLLARNSFTLNEMSWILTKVFFGSSGLGFEVMHEINPKLGPPLMLIYVCMTNILLITSLVCVMRESFSKIFQNARQEHLYVYSVYVLEASTSKSLTHFYPPLNLILLIFIAPLHLFIASSQLRKPRIFILKWSHFPIVGGIWLLEHLPWRRYTSGEEIYSSQLPETTQILFDSVKASTRKRQTFHSGNAVKGDSNRSNSPTSQNVGNDFIGVSNTLREAGIRAKECAKDIPMVNGRERELESKVADLSAQITELMGLLMKSQSNSSPNT